MHLVGIVMVLAIAWQLRQLKVPLELSWHQRWNRCLFLLLFPPLLLLSTALAVICMGFQGEMLGVRASWLGYIVSWGLVIFAGCLLLKSTYHGVRSLQQLNTYRKQTIADKTVRILTLDLPYIAQIGFWNSQLVVSEGLLEALDEEHLTAVFAHEEAHAHYRDTFWFFWFGWLRCITNWLPQTASLWQELLLLRELRADYQAAAKTNSLLLAESLLTVVKAPLESPQMLSAHFSYPANFNRLETRIDFLLSDESIPKAHWLNWSWLALLLLPFITIPLHS
ncbi:M56 family metallopeptidase [Myxosarcina sp. GI1]|uniref:M56 family metallopeptidase n=1 Tax=Myxosarcina sp. GI1 TaxID=1541065 RepID=UPI00055CF19C|nr:M56 family metallopeptidase [Myxosarcina sp. GI1]